MRRIVLTPLILTVAALTAPAAAQCVTRDFEDLPDGALVGSEYAGLTFESFDPTGTCLSFPNILTLGANQVVYAGFDSDPLCATHVQDLIIRFDQLQQNVSLRVGAWTSSGVNVRVRAFATESGLSGPLFDSTVAVASGVNPAPLSIARPSPQIRRVVVTASSSAGELIDDLAFDDFTPPTAYMRAPAYRDCGCDQVSIVGVACDADGAYGYDEAHYRPVEADPADESAWQLIGTYSSPLCAEGVLYTWDASGLPEGEYYVRLTVYNACGSAREAVTVVRLDRDFDTVDVRTPGSGGVYGGRVCFDGTVWDHQCFDHYTVSYAPSGTSAWAPVEAGAPIYGDHVTNDPFASWDTIALGLPDGDYRVRVIGTSHCGHTQTRTRTVTVDNTPAIAEITSPLACEILPGELIEFRGTASDANLTNWSLQVVGGDIRDWTEFASGQAAVVDDRLALWDTRQWDLRPCAYAVRLVVNTGALVNCVDYQRSVDHVTFTVGTAGGGTCPGDLDGDGVIGISDLALLLAAFGLPCP